MKLARLAPPCLRWRDAAHLPPAWPRWLLSHGSMTALLRQQVPDLRLTLVAQAPCPLRAAEQRLLETRARSGICRQVALGRGSTPLVLAWTQLTPAVLSASGLSSLGGEFLGARLFADPAQAPQREALQVARFIAEEGTAGFARRSRLRWQGWPLLVHELFLPALQLPN
ncbi:MAG: chorismate--pyruvate lyase family protein [Aeromonas sp.]